MSDFYLLITDAGKALEAAAHASGEPVKLTDFSVGDGNGLPVTPDAAQTSLVNETFRDAISSLIVSISDSTVLEAECVIPASSGGYTIREIGIFAEDSTLYAVGNFAEQEKPDPDSGYAASLKILADLAVSDTADITLTVQDGSYLTEAQGNTIYLRQDKHLSEIAAQGVEAQAESRGNIGCGTAATHDVTESPTDATAGRVLQVGDYGLSKAIPITKGTDLFTFLSNEPGSFYHCDSPSEYTNAPDFGGNWFDIYMTIHETSGYRTMVAVSAMGQLATAGITDGAFSGWSSAYSTINKPAPLDINAFPTMIINLDSTVDLNTIGAIEQQGVFANESNGVATPEHHYPINQAGTLIATPSAYGLQQEYTTFTGSKFVRGLSGAFDGAGPWGGWIQILNLNESDTRYPQRDGISYIGLEADNPDAPYMRRISTGAEIYLASQNWVKGSFVQDLRVGANQSQGATDNYATSIVPAGCVMTGTASDYNDSNWQVDAIYYAPIQKLVNGAWFGIAGGVGLESALSLTARRKVKAIKHGALLTQLTNLQPYRNDKTPVGCIDFICDDDLLWTHAAPLLAGNVFIAFDSAGVIRQIASDATMIEPKNLSVAGFSGIPDGCFEDGSWIYDGETIYQNPDALAAQTLLRNQGELNSVRGKAAAAILDIQCSAAAGNQRSGDADNLLVLQQYVDELRDVDLTAADPAWPPVPSFIS
ncbi:MAG TPA: phage tail protein [Scandinavium sp.]|jgi:hypothetical protein